MSRLNIFFKDINSINDDILSYIAQEFSWTVWDKLRFFCKNKGIGSMNETTFTEEMIFSINQIVNTGGFKTIGLYQAKNEKVNGADIEIVIGLQLDDEDYKYLAFPIQAKAIKFPLKTSPKDGNYYHFFGKTKNDERTQYQKLIDYSKSINGMPLYMFYNYSERYNISKINKKILGIDVNSLESYHWGCSIIAAQYIAEVKQVKDKKRKDPMFKFSDFHTITPHSYHAIPWFLLFNLPKVIAHEENKKQAIIDHIKNVFNININDDYFLIEDDIDDLNYGYECKKIISSEDTHKELLWRENIQRNFINEREALYYDIEDLNIPKWRIMIEI
ncbi:MAG: hypothetical protein MUC49_13995 [Raineya sp.]|jgi:hypothetical protein|nr:hypothetical protein [Raineya sp.]